MFIRASYHKGRLCSSPGDFDFTRPVVWDTILVKSARITVKMRQSNLAKRTLPLGWSTDETAEKAATYPVGPLRTVLGHLNEKSPIDKKMKSRGPPEGGPPTSVSSGVLVVRVNQTAEACATCSLGSPSAEAAAQAHVEAIDAAGPFSGPVDRVTDHAEDSQNDQSFRIVSSRLQLVWLPTKPSGIFVKGRRVADPGTDEGPFRGGAPHVAPQVAAGPAGKRIREAQARRRHKRAVRRPAVAK